MAAACGGTEAVDPLETGSAPVDVVVVESPLQASLGFPSEPGRRQFQLLTMQLQANAAITTCMTSAGFDYATGAIDESLRSGAFGGDGSRSWASVHGLGITSSFLDALRADHGQVADAAAANLAIVSSLNAEQAAAYDVALVGELPSSTTTTEFEPQGCWAAAFADLVKQLGLINEFAPELDAMNSRLRSDPRVLAFDQTWSECMDAQGYRYARHQDLVDDLYARLLQVELLEVEGKTVSRSPEVLDELLRSEQQVGLASFDCEQGFRSDLERLRYNYENEFLDDNRFRIGVVLEEAH